MMASLWEALGEPKLSDWGFGVTTCIAAISLDRAIVTASDTRMAFGSELSVGDVIKLEGIYGEWAVLIAGPDISQAPFIIERAREILRRKTGTLLAVKNALRRAFQEQLTEVIESELRLGTLNITLKDLKKEHRKGLEPKLYQELSSAIKNAKLGCRFLTYGFDDNEQPHIFDVGDPGGKAESLDKPGFWAIGNGKSSAITTLAQLGQSSEATRMEATIYNVLAAKFTSETASDVGRDTFFFVKRYGCNSFKHRGNLLADVRRIWEEKGRPSVPPEALQAIQRAEISFPLIFKAQGIKPSAPGKSEPGT